MSSRHEIPGATVRTKTSSPASVYFNLLAAGGYRPQLASDAEPTIIRFTSEGEDYLLLVEDGDPHFFHVATAYELGEVDFASAVSRANELNEELKGIKTTVWTPDGSVRIHVECFVQDLPGSVALLERAIGAIEIAARKFFEPARPPERLDA